MAVCYDAISPLLMLLLCRCLRYAMLMPPFHTLIRLIIFRRLMPFRVISMPDAMMLLLLLPLLRH